MLREEKREKTRCIFVIRAHTLQRILCVCNSHVHRLAEGAVMVVEEKGEEGGKENGKDVFVFVLLKNG